MPEDQQQLEPGAGVWFCDKASDLIISIPPPKFFDDVPEQLSLRVAASYPLIICARVFIRQYQEVSDYVASNPAPEGNAAATLAWGETIADILMDEGFSFIYQNYLVTKGTDGADLKRTLRRLPEYVKQHWSPDDSITVCLALGIDIEPVMMTWRELVARETPRF
jgi:hypothetical protein